LLQAPAAAIALIFGNVDFLSGYFSVNGLGVGDGGLVKMKVLLVEDDAQISALVINALRQANFDVEHTDNGLTGLEKSATGLYDLLILDLMLPGLDGLALLERMKEMSQWIPTLILSAKGDLDDRLLGFELGACDYIPKPFYVEELVARVRAALAKREGIIDQSLMVGDLRLDRVSRQVHWLGIKATLSQREFSVLELLMRSPGHIFSRKQILLHVWEIDFDPNTNVVDVCIQRIKRKLTRHQNTNAELPIDSVRGVGYRMNKSA
jgi:DNA-binding response OmpR family regulator